MDKKSFYRECHKTIGELSEFRQVPFIKIDIENTVLQQYKLLWYTAKNNHMAKKMPWGFLKENELHSMPEISDDDFLDIFGHTKDYV